MFLQSPLFSHTYRVASKDGSDTGLEETGWEVFIIRTLRGGGGVGGLHAHNKDRKGLFKEI